MTMRFLATLLLVGLLVSSTASAREMIVDSEQFYVSQGLFTDLSIQENECTVQDDSVNFACGTYGASVQIFQQAVNAHVRQKLPGLTATTEWFNNAGSLVRMYQSASGTYVVSYNAGGEVVIAFTPF